MVVLPGERYICLAAYRCPCSYVGKPVSRTTLMRHRRIANERRRQSGLPQLQNGPRYSEQNANLQYTLFLNGDEERCGSEGVLNTETNGAIRNRDETEFENAISRETNDTDRDATVQQCEQLVPVIEIEDTFSHHGATYEPMLISNNNENIDSSYMRFDEETSSSPSALDVVGEGIQIPDSLRSGGDGALSDTPVFGIQQSDAHENLISGSDQLEFQPASDEVAAQTTEEAQPYSTDTTGNEMDWLNLEAASSEADGGDDYQHGGQDTALIESGGIHATARERFDEWVRSYRDLIFIFIDHGLTQRAQDAIMGFLKAPLKVRQLRKNFEKYTNYSAIRYLACRKHMLLTSADASDDTEVMCVSCLARDTDSDYVFFEYLPLLPRIRSWASMEGSCKDLFAYHQGKLDERIAFNADIREEPVYEDFFDCKVYWKIIQSVGGAEAVRYDIFIAPSTDGFQTFENNSYDCWPIAALNYNLHPDKRYLVKNIIPLGFIQGPREPEHVDTWFTPLAEEIARINEGGGAPVQFFDGVERRVRVHIIYETGDKPSVNKQAGLMGHNARCPCRFCVFSGAWSPLYKHVYYPTRCSVLTPPPSDPTAFKIALGDEEGEIENRVLWDPMEISYRNPEDIEQTLAMLEDENISNAEKERIRTRSGIKWRTVPLSVHSVYPYVSFPLDTMHTWMNVCKDMISIFKGKCDHLREVWSDDRFVITSAQWIAIDIEMDCIPKGTSLSAFPDVPRNTQHYSSWKAAECLEFLTNYATIVFDGILPHRYLRNLHTLSQLVELSRRPVLSQNDVDRMKHLGVQFVRTFEMLYYRYDSKRAGVCKSTIHDIVHLGWMVEQCGPLVNYSQFWVERYIGFIKNLLNATVYAAESMNETTKMTERVKIYFGNHFVSKRTGTENGVENWDGSASPNGLGLLSPCDVEKITNSYHAQKRTRKLLAGYICRAEGLSDVEANAAVQGNEVLCFGRATLPVGSAFQVIGASQARRHRRQMKRSDWFIAAEFCTEVENHRDVYYGKVLKFLRYKFMVGGLEITRDLILAEWANGLQINQFGHVYKPAAQNAAFRNSTVEDLSVLMHSVGVLEHNNPRIRRKQTLFVDPNRGADNLLDKDRCGQDGVNRNLVVSGRRA